MERRNRLVSHFERGMISADEAAIHFLQMLMNEAEETDEPNNEVSKLRLLESLPEPFATEMANWIRRAADSDFLVHWVALEDGRSERQIESDGKAMQAFLAASSETILQRIEP